MTVHNFVMDKRHAICQKFQNIRPIYKRVQILYLTAFKYALLSLHETSLCVNYTKFDKMCGFYQIFNANMQQK